jgi:sugar/nucleoside kinase (ribokinase family)
MKKRCGIAAAGNWIVDRVKIVDRLPERGMLANIKSVSISTGGAPANVLADLARMKVSFPLTGIGVVGDDDDGRLILEKFNSLGVDVENIRSITKAPTSFTDVMIEEDSGDRTFFHHRGANAFFSPSDVPVSLLNCKIFHLGYLLLLDAMDASDENYGTQAARLLMNLQKYGIKTSVDVVSEHSDRFKIIVPPALKFVNYLIVNEIEAGRIVGRKVRNSDNTINPDEIRQTVDELFALGNMEIVAVHMPEGAYVCTCSGNRCSLGSLILPDSFIKSKVGAGDAFCAGMLYGLHEEWDIEKCTILATCCAAASLSHEGASDGLRPLNELLELADKFPKRKAPVPV